MREIMVAEHPNLATFRSIYAAFTSGDMDMLATFFGEDVVWHTPGRHRSRARTRGGTLHSRRSLRIELSAGTYSVEVHDVLAVTSTSSRSSMPRQSGRANDSIRTT